MTLSRYRVAAGYVLGAGALFAARPDPDWFLPAAACIAAGEAIRVWASGHIEKTERLATGGPYAHTRNPLYVGSLLIAVGAGTFASSTAVVAMVAVYFVAFYPAVIHEEADFLRRKFPDAYAAWAHAVPPFLPRLTPGGPRESRFAWARVARNREWRTVATIPLILAVLYARGRWLP